MNKQEIRRRASDKAFAQVTQCTIGVRRTKKELKTGVLGGLTEDQLLMVLDSEETELKVWNFISELIEKSNKNE
jgi:hypothetical protein